MDTVPLHPDRWSVWDIVRVDFPFADRAAARERPALVVAAIPVHADFSILWLAMITSASAGRWPFDVAISDLKAGDLLRPCFVRTSKIAAIDARLAIRTGMLASIDRQAVAATLRTILAPALTP